MIDFLKQFFTWWNGQTLGTRFFTWRKGRFAGEDEAGNKYYQTADGLRRWVIYNGYADASAIPPGWHGWMHHRVDTPPQDDDYQPRDWQKPHLPNQTGTENAYHPPGSLTSANPEAAARPGYQAWTPQTPE